MTCGELTALAEVGTCASQLLQLPSVCVHTILPMKCVFTVVAIPMVHACSWYCVHVVVYFNIGMHALIKEHLLCRIARNC